MEIYPITDRSSWLTLRQRDVTASEVAALFGLSKWDTALSLYAAKKGLGRPKGDNTAMRGGRIMEPAIAQAVQEEKPEWTLEKASKYYRDPVFRIGCTPDYFRTQQTDSFTIKKPIECKFVQPKIFEADWKDGPPLMYVLQTLVQIYVTEAPAGYIAVMLDNRAKDTFIYDVPRNQAAWDRIVARVAQFWQDVDADVMPGANYAMDGDELKALFPADAKQQPLDLRDDNRLPAILAEREACKARMKADTASVEAIDAEIIDKLRGAPEAVLNGYRVSYKQQTRKETIQKASMFSVLRITTTKEDFNV